MAKTEPESQPRERSREEQLVGKAASELERYQNLLGKNQALLAIAEHNGDKIAAAGAREMIGIYQRRIELFWKEHDNAGAFKIKKFDRQLLEYFTGSPEAGQKQVIETGSDGRFELAEGQENRRLVFIDMLELDRLNKEGGGHDAGDAGLTATVELLGKAAAQLNGPGKRPPAFDIFRSGGNQFAVNFESIDDAALEAFMQTIASSRAEVAERIGKPVEGAPLTATAVNLKDVIEDLNSVQEQTGAPFEPGEEAAREIMQIMLRAGDWGGEVRKFHARAERVREKIERGDPDTQGFFDNYVAKALKGTPFGTFEDFRKTLEGGAFEKTVAESAFDAARTRFDLDRGIDAAEGALIDKQLRQEIVRSRVEARRASKEKKKTAPEGEGLAKIPEETRGQALLRMKKEEAERARKAAEESEAASTERSLLRAEAENARLDYDIEAAQRNAGTGLLERGSYYEDLERALAEKKPTTSVFIDMGFLKYFDQKGGPDVGNVALKSAAHLIEQALEKAGLKGEAYRYGGDEFTMLFEGTQEDAKKFTQALSILKEQFGKIPAGPKSKPEYVPTELQFNYGVSDVAELDETLEQSGRRDSPLNKRADILTKIADQRVEYMKAVSRFDYLIGEMRKKDFHDAKIGTEPGAADAYSRQVEAKIEYSRKALFAELGGESALRIFSDELRRLSESPGEREGLEEEIEDQVRKFVMDRIEAAHKMENESKQLLDRFLEARTRISYLEEERERLSNLYDDEHRRVKDLKAELSKAKKELEEIKQVRSSLAA